MSTVTPNLGLFKYDILADANAAFNINTALNNNWDKIDEAISNSGGARNIGEIVASTIPLTDAGLHLLDGALIQGDGIYSDFVSYIGDLYNTTDKTYKASAFTVVGSPTITSDGIASGISSSNYLTASGLTLGNDFEINIKFTTSSTLNVRQILYRASDSSFKFLLGINTSGNLYLSGIIEKSLMNLSANTSYTIRLVVKNNNCYTYINNTLVDTTSVSVNYNALNFTIGVGSSAGDPFLGSIDLKEIVFLQSGITILNGASVNGFCLESEWQQSVTNYGVCGNFVYEPSNNTVRLPKYGNQIITKTSAISTASTVPVVGNGITLGLTDGTNNFGFQTISGNNSGHSMVVSGAYGTNIGSASSTSYVGANKTFGVTSDDTKSGLIADISSIKNYPLDCYYYIVIATSTKTAIQVDIDEIATDLNGKMDTDLSNMSASPSAKNEIISWRMPDYNAGISKNLNTVYFAESNLFITVQIAFSNNYVGILINDENIFPSDISDIGTTAKVIACYGGNFNTNSIVLDPTISAYIPKGMYYKVYSLSYLTREKIIIYPLLGGN